MKRTLIIVASITVLVVAGITIARADAPGWRRWHHGPPFGMIAHQLNLNSTQQEQIQQLWHAERPTVAGLVREFSAESKEMSAATAQGATDDAKVEEIARRQGETVAKLLVEKQRMKEKVYATVLTPQQRTKADAMLDKFQSHLDKLADRLESH
jgi:Spy/CpxP family protein refolding chaperone